MEKFDVIIIGAGPAGCSAALELAKQNLKIAILDKATFPRDKTCGDALSADVVKQIKQIDTDLYNSLIKLTSKKEVKNLHLFDPFNYRIDFNVDRPDLECFVVKRFDLDYLFFSSLKDKQNIEIFENQTIQAIEITPQQVEVKTASHTFFGKIILGADGANSAVKRILTGKNVNKNHFCAGLRQYYKNVTPFEENNGIELHFFKETLPGYLWIFPAGNNQFNVGIGMLSSEIISKNINLKKLFKHLIENHPVIKERFKHAEPLESAKGFGLPLGSKKIKCSGNRFLLLGDAANLIDPFTGEGIANAIRSGRVAAQHLEKAFAQNNFSASFNKAYDKELYRRLWPEFRIGRFMQLMLYYPKVFSFVIKRANQSISFRNYLVSIALNSKLPKLLKQPAFYFKLLFSRK